MTAAKWQIRKFTDKRALYESSKKCSKPPSVDTKAKRKWAHRSRKNSRTAKMNAAHAKKKPVRNMPKMLPCFSFAEIRWCNTNGSRHKARDVLASEPAEVCVSK